MAKKKVFISFDYENDKIYKFLLEAWCLDTLKTRQKFDIG